MPSPTDLHALTFFYTSIVDGMAIRAKDGASRKSLDAIVDCAMAAWDPLAGRNTAKRERRHSDGL